MMGEPKTRAALQNELDRLRRRVGELESSHSGSAIPDVEEKQPVWYH